MPVPCITVDIVVGPAVVDMLAAFARVTGAGLLASSAFFLSASEDREFVTVGVGGWLPKFVPGP